MRNIVNVVARLCSGQSRVQFVLEARDFSLLQNVQRGCGAKALGTGSPFCVVEMDGSPLCSVEVKNSSAVSAALCCCFRTQAPISVHYFMFRFSS
jgi:hypothetical protein